MCYLVSCCSLVSQCYIIVRPCVATLSRSVVLSCFLVLHDIVVCSCRVVVSCVRALRACRIVFAASCAIGLFPCHVFFLMVRLIMLSCIVVHLIVLFCMRGCRD